MASTGDVGVGTMDQKTDRQLEGVALDKVFEEGQCGERGPATAPSLPGLRARGRQPSTPSTGWPATSKTSCASWGSSRARA